MNLPGNFIVYCFLLLGSERLYSKAADQFVVEGPKCALEDTAHIPKATLNVSLPPLITLQEGSFMENFTLVGLSTLKYRVAYNITLITGGVSARFEVSANILAGNTSHYSTHGSLDVRPLPDETVISGDFAGSGNGEFDIENISFNGTVKVRMFLNRTLKMQELSIENISFDKLSLNLENYKVNDNLIDWEKFNQNIKTNFDRDWAIHKGNLSSKILETAKPLVDGLTLDDIIDLIGGSQGEDDNCKGSTPPVTSVTEGNSGNDDNGAGSPRISSIVMITFVYALCISYEIA